MLLNGWTYHPKILRTCFVPGCKPVLEVGSLGSVCLWFLYLHSQTQAHTWWTPAVFNTSALLHIFRLMVAAWWRLALERSSTVGTLNVQLHTHLQAPQDLISPCRVSHSQDWTHTGSVFALSHFDHMFRSSVSDLLLLIMTSVVVEKSHTIWWPHCVFYFESQPDVLTTSC